MTSQYEDFKLEILHAIYQDAFRPGSLSAFAVGDLKRLLPAELIRGITTTILGELVNDKYLDRESNYYRISSKGIKHVEIIFADFESESMKEKKPIAWTSNGTIEIPASDRIVALNHNGDPYIEAMNALGEALTAFRQDHRLENEWGPEKGVLIASIEGGQRLLREVHVRVRSIVATTLEPLRIIADRYRDAINAGLITAGVDHVLPTVENSINSLLHLLGLS